MVPHGHDTVVAFMLGPCLVVSRGSTPRQHHSQPWERPAPVWIRCLVFSSFLCFLLRHFLCSDVSPRRTGGMGGWMVVPRLHVSIFPVPAAVLPPVLQSVPAVGGVGWQSCVSTGWEEVLRPTVRRIRGGQHHSRFSSFNDRSRTTRRLWMCGWMVAWTAHRVSSPSLFSRPETKMTHSKTNLLCRDLFLFVIRSATCIGGAAATRAVHTHTRTRRDGRRFVWIDFVLFSFYTSS